MELKDALNVVKDYIANWECIACLEYGPDSFRLQFERAEIRDRNPTPGVTNLQATFPGFRLGSISATLTVGMPNYPAPPSGVNFRDPNVQTMHQRYMGYRQGNEPLASMAYFCLTVLEHSMGSEKIGRRAAAGEYRIAFLVLDRIGKLSSEKGGQFARKGDAVANDFTSQERTFLEQAIQRIIRRAAEKAHSPDRALPQISLSDLPSI